MNRMALGTSSALTGACLWGISGAATQYLYAHYDISGLFITAARISGAAVLFALLLAFRYRPQVREIMSSAHGRASVAVFGCIGLLLCQVTYVVAIGYTNAGTTTVLQSTNIVIIMVAACLMARRPPAAADVLGLVLAVTAVFLVATKGNAGTLQISAPGLAWGLASAVTAAVYTMYPRQLFARWGSMPVIGLGMISGALVAVAIFALAHIACVQAPVLTTLFAFPALDLTGIGVLAFIAVVGTFAAFGLFLYGVSIVGSVKGSLFGADEPVSATVFSTLLGSAFTGADWAGLVLMVAAIFLVSVRPAHPHKLA